MSDLDRSVNYDNQVTLATPAPCAVHRPAGLVAGEALEGMQACYVKASGGISKVFLCDGSAADEKAHCRGFAAMDCPLGKGVTLLRGVHVGGYVGLTPGAEYYLSETAGELSTVATPGGQVPVAWAWNDTTIVLCPEGIASGLVELGALLANVPVVHAQMTAGTNLTAVPGSFADVAAVRTYLLTLVSEIEARFDAHDTEVRDVVADLTTAGIFVAS